MTHAPSGRLARAFTAALLFFAASSQAQVYLGLAAGSSQLDVDCMASTRCDRQDGAYKVFGGYMVSHEMAVEVAVLRQGTAATTLTDATAGTVQARYRAQGLGAYGVLIAPYSNRFNVFGKLGVVNTRVTIDSVSSVNGAAGQRERHINLAWGVGGGFDPTPSVGLRLEFERERAKLLGTHRDIDLLTASVLYRF